MRIEHSGWEKDRKLEGKWSVLEEGMVGWPEGVNKNIAYCNFLLQVWFVQIIFLEQAGNFLAKSDSSINFV